MAERDVIARRLDRTTVIAIIASEQDRTAQRTLAELPRRTQILRLETEFAWPAALLDLLPGTMRLIVPGARPLTRISRGRTTTASATLGSVTEMRVTSNVVSTIVDRPVVSGTRGRAAAPGATWPAGTA